MRAKDLCSRSVPGAILLCAAAFAPGAPPAMAALLTFDDRTGWLAAGAVPNGGETFDTVTTAIAFGGAASFFNGVRYSGVTTFPFETRLVPAGSAEFGGSAHLRVAGISAGESMTIDFRAPLIAVGFEWENFDFDGDDWALALDGQPVAVNVSAFGDTGFFGVFSTDETFRFLTITAVTSGPTGGLFNAFDTFETQATGPRLPEPIPLPGTLPLLIGAVAALGLARMAKPGR